MWKYELRPSLVKNYQWVCMLVEYTTVMPPDPVRAWIKEHMGQQGIRHMEGICGFYFKNQEDAVQFILTWG